MPPTTPINIGPTPGPLPTNILEVPAVYVNFYQIAVNPIFSRLTFGESAGPGSPDLQIRVSVSLATADLKGLADMILETIKQQTPTPSAPQLPQ
jgi:hypothetical protein